jgi:undecaprenyl pyrophosphate phosphatase UppP
MVMGLLLILASLRQSWSNVTEKPLHTHSYWLFMGIAQSIGMLIPVTSRLGASLIPGILKPMEFRKTLVISYALETFILIFSATLDLSTNQLILPSMLELFTASFGFGLGWAILERFQWRFIGLVGVYRVILGALLLTGCM